MTSRPPSCRSAIPIALLAVAAALAGCSEQSADPTQVERQDARTASASTANPTVSSIKPASAPQDTTLEVAVYGSNFERGSTVALGIDGVPSGDVVTNSTRFVSQRELRANLTIAPDAVTGSYDVIVITSTGRKGIGTELFAVRGKDESITVTALPSLGSNAEGWAVNASGTVMVGSSFDRAGYLYAVKWTLQGGSWVISTLPYYGSASAQDVDDAGNAAGYYASSPRHGLLWPASGGSQVLDCDSDIKQSSAYAISNDGRLVGGAAAGPAVWRPGSCRQILPVPADASGGTVMVLNGNGTIAGGPAYLTTSGSSFPVRWRLISGQWQVERLDPRLGSVTGANAAGDLTGYVKVPCALAEGCNRAMIWYANGTSRQLGTLGGEHIWANDINASGEVVGISTGNRVSTVFFWSEARGMVELPIASDGGAYGLSDVRPDATRIAVGSGGTPHRAQVWVIRDP